MNSEEKILEILTKMQAQLDRMETRQDRAETLVPMKRLEKVEDDIVILKLAVKALARDVAELKKAE